MEFLYYTRQWPGSKLKTFIRFLHIGILELKRYFFGDKYLAEFDLSDDCNLRCKHCYHFRAKERFSSEKIDIKVWEKLFNKLHRQGIRRVLLIGGEPAIRMDVIKLAHTIFPYIDICSNGTIKVPEWYTQKIFVSIDGTKEMHDFIRGEGVFDRVIENYNNDNRVVISMTITKDNFLLIEDVVKLSITNGMIGVSCDIYTPSPDNNTNDSMYITDEIRLKIINEIKRIKKIYPNNFLMSNKAIEWFENPNHLEQKCYWRSETIHFNSQLIEKEACDYYDCSNCGHFAGANLSPLTFLISKKK